EVNQLRVFVAANLGEHTRRFGVDAKSLVRLCLAKIDISKRRRVDEHIEICRAQFLSSSVQIRQIELGVIEAGEVKCFSILPRERSAKPPGRADNQNFHLLLKRVVRKAA